MAEDFTTRTPGQIMRAAREEREQSLHDAHEGTKIPVRLLEAIERDEYHKLSGPLYVKSFLRNYAGWLGLDPEEILAVYELATGRPEPTAATEDEVWTEDQVSVTRVGMPWARLVTIAVAAAVVLVVLVVLAIRLLGGGDEAPAGVTAANEPAVVAEQRPAPADAENADASASPTEGQEQDAAEPAPARTADQTSPALQPKVQPTERNETGAQRLARLNENTLGGVEPLASPTADDTPAETREAGAGAEPTATLAPPRRGVPELHFTGGETFPLVLRVLLPEPSNCTVRRDDQPDAVPVIWPDDPTPPPAYNLRHGRAYAVQGGYAVYWGAEDHFTLTLERVRGAEVTLNGHPQSLRGWRPGQTKLLDLSMLPAGDG